MPDPTWILDTSVAAAWFFTNDDQHVDALQVLEALGQQPDEYAVPELFYSELVHVLARRSGRDEAFVRAGLDAVLDLGIRTIPIDQVALRRAGQLACGGLTGYDATFVGIAEEIGARWLTADERAANVAESASTTLREWARH